jgi:hypothetical protein
MRRAVLVMVIAARLNAGCGASAGDVVDGGLGDAVSDLERIREFCRLYAESAAISLTRCANVTATRTADVINGVGLSESACLEEHEARIAASMAAFDQEKAEECLDRFTDSCAFSIWREPHGRSDPCRWVTVGLLDRGEVCQPGDCRSHLSCIPTSATNQCSAVCAEPIYRNVGDSCDFSVHQLCRAEATCAPQETSPDEGVCIPLPTGVGDRCFGPICPDGMYCDPEIARCARQFTLGSTCALSYLWNDSCLGNDIDCVSAGAAGDRCLRRALLGEPCEPAVAACWPAIAFCELHAGREGTCRLLPSIGDRCEVRCLDRDAYCDTFESHVCMPVKSEGEQCLLSDECSEYLLCRAGSCERWDSCD